MAKRRRLPESRTVYQWHRHASSLLIMNDQGASVRLSPEAFGVSGRDRSWNSFAQNFLSANEPQLRAWKCAPPLCRCRQDQPLREARRHGRCRSPSLCHDPQGHRRSGSPATVRLGRHRTAPPGNRLDRIAPTPGVPLGAWRGPRSPTLGVGRADPRTLSDTHPRIDARVPPARGGEAITSWADHLAAICQRACQPWRVPPIAMPVSRAWPRHAVAGDAEVGAGGCPSLADSLDGC